MLPVSCSSQKPGPKMTGKKNDAVVVSNSPKTVPLSSLKLNQQNGSIIVRVLTSWDVCLKTRSRPVAIEMVLVDNEATKILARLEVAYIYKFGNMLKEGSVVRISNFELVAAKGEYRPTHHDCKLNFQFTSVVQPVAATEVAVPPFDFTPPECCFDRDFNKDYLVDVVGLYVSNEKPTTFGTNRTRMVVNLQNEGVPFTVTFFGDYALEMKALIDAGRATGAVIAVLYCKVNKWPGGIGIQTTQRTSRLLINPDIPEAPALRESSQALILTPLSNVRSHQTQSDEETFLTLEQKYTVHDIRQLTQINDFVTLATINSIVEGIPWWYWACREDYYKCTVEKSTPGLFYCPNCNMHVKSVVRKLFLKLSIHDDTGCIIVTLFDNIVKMLIGKSAEDTYQSWQQDPGKGVYPTEMTDLIGKEAIWRIVAGKKEESDSLPSYKATRVSTAEVVMNKYKEKWSSQGTIDGPNQGVLLIEDTPSSDAIATPKGPVPNVLQEVVDELQESGSGSSSATDSAAAVDLKKDKEEIRLGKRKVQPSAASSSEVPLKNIKMEK